MLTVLRSGSFGAALPLLTLSVMLAACGDDSTVTPIDAGTDTATEDMQIDMVMDTTPDTRDVGNIACDLDSTLGNFCTNDSQCNDRCFCNGTERCRGGVCAAGVGPCDDGIECTVDACDEASTTCTTTADDTVCDDGNECTGTEICDLDVGCVDGLPLNCSDGDSCTIDRCVQGEGCTNTIRDVDGDGYPDSRCVGGTDCNDDPMDGVDINPGAAEICDNGFDDDCDGSPDAFDTDCTPTNDTCASPLVLGGSGFYGWSTQTLSDDYVTDCGDSGSLDAVFQFTATVESDLIASTNGPGGTSLELRGPGTPVVCADDAEFVACDDKASSFSDNPEIVVRRLEPGTYYIIGDTPAEGLWGLSFDLRPSGEPPATDTCVTAPDVGTGGTFAGDWSQHTDAYTPLSCGNTLAYPDAAYRLSLADDSDVFVSASAQTSSGFSTSVAVAILPDCAAPSAGNVACDNGTAPEFLVRPLPAGDYFIMVQSNSSTAVTYELNVDVQPPSVRLPGDACTTAIDITSAPATINIAGLENDGGFGCGGSASPWREAYFTVEVTAESDVTIDASAGGLHILSIASTCGDSSSEVVCTGGATDSSETVRLMPGTYTVGVAVPTTTGSMTVTSTITPI